MADPVDYKAGAAVLRQIVAELEAKLAHPETLNERERRTATELLRIRRLELADLEAYRWGD